MATDRLCVFFEAGGSRYAIEALDVLEVAEPDENQQTLHGHHTLRDLSTLLGGEPEVRPGTALVLDTSPTVAVRVARVEGVFEAGADRLALTHRMVPLLSPAVKGALARHGQLAFELDGESVLRGLPRQTRRLELLTRAAGEPCLVFESGGTRFGVPLPAVKQVVTVGPLFNRAPGRGGAWLGVVLHERTLSPVYSVSGATEPEGLLVLLDLGQEGMGLSAARAEGVREGPALEGVAVLDVAHMFS